MKKAAIIVLSMFLLPVMVLSQAQLVLSGAYVSLSGGTKAKPIYVVIGNGANSGIVRSSGGIISESEFNMIWWDIGTNTGSYTIPFQYSNSRYIPLTYNISTAGGAAGGAVKFSTWHTLADNAVPAAQLPSDVTNMDPATPTSSPSPTDDSYYVVDRFWVIDAGTGYAAASTPQPILTFTYINSGASSEIAAPNALTEANLIAQRFNSTAGTWGDYYGPMTDIAGAGTGTVTTTSAIAPANFFRSWTLSDHSAPLPIQLLSFTAACANNFADIQWSTATETNNDYFTIEKTQDGVHYETVGVVKGAGTSSVQHNYSLVDFTPYNGTSYYSLSQTDVDGKTTQKGSVVYQSCEGDDFINAFTANGFINAQVQSTNSDTYVFSLTNTLGQTVMQTTKNVSQGLNIYKIPANYTPGVYILRITNGAKVYTNKMVL